MIRKPAIEVKDQQGQIVPDNGVTGTGTLTAQLADDESGPGRLEVWFGDPGAGAGGGAGAIRVFFNDTDFDPADHTYSIPALANEGLHVIKGFDRAGNETQVIFGGGAVRSADEPLLFSVFKSPIEKPMNFSFIRSNAFLPLGEESSRGGQAQLPPARGERARSRGVDLPLGPHSALTLAATQASTEGLTQATSAVATQAPTPRARGSAAVVSYAPTTGALHARKLPGHRPRARRVAHRWPSSLGRFLPARAPQARNPLGPRRPAGSAAALFIRSAAGTEEVFHSPPPPNAGRAFGAARVVPINDLSTLSTVSTAKAEDGWVGTGADGRPPWPLRSGVLQRKRPLGAGKKKPLRGRNTAPAIPLSVRGEPHFVKAQEAAFK